MTKKAKKRKHTASDKHEDPPRKAQGKQNRKTGDSEDESSQSRKINRICWLAFGGVMLSMWVYLETHPQANLILNNFKLSIPAGLTALGFLLKEPYKKYIGTGENAKAKLLWLSSLCELRILCGHIIKAKLNAAAALIVVSMFAISFVAHANICGYVLAGAREIASELIQRAEEKEPSIPTEQQEGAAGAAHTAEAVSVPRTDGKTNAPDKTGRSLSTAERESIYFLSGKYAITQWDNPAHVREQVWMFIGDRRIAKREDDELTEGYEKAVLLANSEDNRSNKKACINVIKIREEAWEEARTLQVSNLLAADYHGVAELVIEAPWYAGQDSEYEYYTAHAILWRFTSLDFSDADIEFTIHQIHTRYKELKDVHIEETYAEALEAAFKNYCSHKNCMK